MFEIFVRVFYPASSTIKFPTGKPVSINVDLIKPISKISIKYLSFAIEIPYILGGHCWNSSGKLEFKSGIEKFTPLDLTSKKLQIITSELSPAYLRIGGTEADNVIFDNVYGKKYQLNLTKRLWDKINNFVKKTNLDLFFTVNAGPLVRNNQHQWLSANFESLLLYSKERGYKLSILELGNELNAYWYFHGFFNKVTINQYAKDFKNFEQLMKKYYPRAKIAGPATIYWPRIGEALSFVGNISSSFIKNKKNKTNIFTWHYYPQQSNRCPITFPKAKHGLLLNPQYLNDIGKWARELNLLKDKHKPQSEVWLGEVGNALCGGQPDISDTFESSLWWADVLGLMATMKQKVIIRQSLVGSTYSLLEKDSLNPLPDFWASLIWKKIIGTEVYKVHNSDDNPFIRIYAHSTNKKLNLDTNSIVILFINLENKENYVTLKNINTDKAIIYQLTAKNLNDKSIFLNNRMLILRKGAIPIINGEQIKIKKKKIKLAPLSITYFIFPFAKIK